MPSSRFAASPHRRRPLDTLVGSVNCAQSRLACPLGRFIAVRPCCKSFDLGAAVVNTGATHGNFRHAARAQTHRSAAEHWASPTVFTSAERQDHMSNNEKSDRKPARSERDKEAERRAQEKALDKALEESFPASDPISPSAPAPTRD
jgi:hypothetical protein